MIRPGTSLSLSVWIIRSHSWIVSNWLSKKL